MKTNRQLVYLFLCNFSILFVGFGLFPILPLHAAELGAGASFIGIYLGITYIAISIGSILAGQLSGRLPRRVLLIASGLAGIPALVLLGQAQDLWQVVALTALVWFAGGVGLAVLNVLAGLRTDSSRRGKAFGLLALASPLGALIGGLVVGRSLELGGYPLMFLVIAVIWSMFPILAITRLQDQPDCDAPPVSSSQASVSSGRPGWVFMLLLITVLLASMTVSVGRMGLSLEMKDHQYSASDVSTANAIGGLVTIPVTLLTGAFSDRLGRKRFLFVGYLVAMGSALLLLLARELWQFWLVSSLVLSSRSVVSAMSPAYTTDLVRRRFLGKALPLVGTMNWASGVAGFAGAGYILDTFGAAVLYGATAFTALLAAILLAYLPASLRPQVSQPAAAVKEAVPSTGD